MVYRLGKTREFHLRVQDLSNNYVYLGLNCNIVEIKYHKLSDFELILRS